MGCRFKGRYERLTYYKREDLIEKSDIVINQGTQKHINTTDYNRKPKNKTGKVISIEETRTREQAY